MKLKLIICKVFAPEFAMFADTPGVERDVEYLELGEHAGPDLLRQKLQEKINEARGYDAVVLGYGLCGRATEGIQAVHCPVVIFRSHDCGGILLGSRKKYEELFREMPSTPFSSAGFIESGDYFREEGELAEGGSYRYLVEKYGEENAIYIREAMQPKLDGKLRPVYFIRTVDDDRSLRKCRERASAEGREVIEVQGSVELLHQAACGILDEDAFLILRPGEKSVMTGGWTEIIKAVPAKVPEVDRRRNRKKIKFIS